MRSSTEASSEYRIRDRIAWRLRFLADRLSPETAFRRTHWRFEFVRHVGVEFSENGQGCPLWYRTADYYKAHERGRS